MNKAEQMREISKNAKSPSLKAVLSYIKKQASLGRTECNYTLSKREIDNLKNQGFTVVKYVDEEPPTRCLIAW